MQQQASGEGWQGVGGCGCRERRRRALLGAVLRAQLCAARRGLPRMWRPRSLESSAAALCLGADPLPADCPPASSPLLPLGPRWFSSAPARPTTDGQLLARAAGQRDSLRNSLGGRLASGRQEREGGACSTGVRRRGSRAAGTPPSQLLPCVFNGQPARLDAAAACVKGCAVLPSRSWVYTCLLHLHVASFCGLRPRCGNQ